MLWRATLSVNLPITQGLSNKLTKRKSSSSVFSTWVERTGPPWWNSKWIFTVINSYIKYFSSQLSLHLVVKFFVRRYNVNLTLDYVIFHFQDGRIFNIFYTFSLYLAWSKSTSSWKHSKILSYLVILKFVHKFWVFMY